MKIQNLLLQQLSYMQPKPLISIVNAIKVDFDSADRAMKALIGSGQAAAFAQGYVKLATKDAYAACCTAAGDDDDGRGNGPVEVAE